MIAPGPVSVMIATVKAQLDYDLCGNSGTAGTAGTAGPGFAVVPESTPVREFRSSGSSGVTGHRRNMSP